MNKISSSHGKINDFIYLHPQFTTDKQKINFLTAEKKLVKLIFFAAKFLKTTLTEGVDSSFMTVTQLDGQLGCGAEHTYGVYAGGLFGLVKTLNIEWKNVFCRSLDLDPNYTKKEKSTVIVEEFFTADNRIVEIGHKDHRRCTLEGVQENRNDITAVTNPINKDSLFIVSGGGKGVTAACTINLAKRYGCKFIIFGRSDITVPEPQWAKDVSEEMELKKHLLDDLLAKGDKPTPVKIQKVINGLLGNREIKSTINAIRQVGAMVEYIVLDITEGRKLSTALKPMTKKWGKITGIIHGAGVLADKLIERKSEDDYNYVIGTKVDGLENLLNCVTIADLDSVILFSSSAGFYGNEAQADYSLANEILSKTAYLLKIINPTCHSIAYNWGPWDGGMVTEQLKKMFEERDIEIIPLEEGANMPVADLHRVMVPQIIVGGSMVVPVALAENGLDEFKLKRILQLTDNPFLTDHKIEGRVVLPLVSALSWMMDSCLQHYPGFYCVSADDIRVLNGIALTENQKSEFWIEIKEVQKSRQQGAVSLEVKISSLTNDKKIRFHYSSRVTLESKLPKQPLIDRRLLKVSAQNRNENPYLDKTLFHTGVFREIIKSGETTPRGIVLKCRSSKLPPSALGQFPNTCFNAVADDTMLQAMLVWVRKSHQAGSLPLLIKQAEFFQPLPEENDFYVILEIVANTPHKMSGNIVTCDQEGNVFTRFSGAEVTISKNLTKKF